MIVIMMKGASDLPSFPPRRYARQSWSLVFCELRMSVLAKILCLARVLFSSTSIDVADINMTLSSDRIPQVYSPLEIFCEDGFYILGQMAREGSSSGLNTS